ncbi:hypothetical protein FDE76_12340 [Clostridium botulinum]|uniref:DUF5348 domain-containing protein n=1 Tax=Clostridium botulinum (strain Eklund 17B / Type B) TaxID=935198 RepID=B2THD8_CLOBB|nr:conserved hypothetical protein [Clostridium botulinum B str. Eklund 17B (NRP)]MBY6977427.1 DUF5348 domain-containing protein [Clostridium botulinum]MBY7001982.1 DUF5348 domain-containing protein [Clostridium botulinum]MCR1275571.1 DUF5348 domain-containing protein [Clostridium botulinum]NFD71020.1 hypothetical protein [Clostridium botulinum]
MSKRTGILGYNYNNERYSILNAMDLWEDSGLHCGEVLEVFIDGKWIADRIEIGKGEWYLIYSKLHGEQLEGLRIRF